MYSITEIIMIQILCFVIVFNLKLAINYFKKKCNFFNGKFTEEMNEFIKFYNFICENNPLILDYFEILDLPSEIEDIKDSDKKKEKYQEQNFEDKYLEKFKKFSNEFNFDELELDAQKNEYENIKLDYEKTKLNTINTIQEQLIKINQIQENGNISDVTGHFTENINSFGINCLLIFFDITEEYNEDPSDFDIEELYLDLLKNKIALLKNMEEIEKTVISDEKICLKSREAIINKKLDKYINNYVLEHTPLGNIYMRYNNDKKSFEYFSNNTIPYRYLEAVGRKYVMTYWCKPIFVDIDEELKKAEERYDEEIKRKEEEEKKKAEERKTNPKKILAQLKNYNKETKDQTMRLIKNRTNKNSTLPPQIQSNLHLPDVNKSSNKQLLKEKANRYTWEGRLTNFCPLKKIDKKILNSKLAMTYADFKKIQQNKK
jgi:hypothetical protein